MSPADHGIVTAQQPVFRWLPAEGAIVYFVLIDDVLRVETAATTYQPDTPLAYGAHSWSVVASRGTQAAASEVRTFTISAPLYAPTLLAPSDGSSLETGRPQLVWTVVDGAESYRLFVDDTLLVTTTATSSTPSVELSLGQHNWQVHAAGGEEAVPSETWSFTIQSTDLQAAELLSPADQGIVADQQPIFRWLPAQGAEVYFVLIDTVLMIETAATTFQPDIPLAYGAHSWSIVASRDTQTAASEVRTFTIPAPLYPPTLVAPSDGSSTDTRQPELVWSVVNGAELYGLFIDEALLATTTATSWTPSVELSLGQHSWRVHATRGGEAAPSETWTFSVEAGFSPPALIAPASQVELANRRPEFVWTPSVGADSYLLFLDGVTLASTTQTSHIPSSDLALGLHSWSVAAVSVDEVVTSDPWTFRIVSAPLTAPLLVSPVDEEQLFETTPTFLWSEVTEADSYFFYLDGGFVTETTAESYVPSSSIPLGKHTWGVAAVRGTELALSGTHRFTIDFVPPEVITPVEGTMTYNARPPITWTASGAEIYQVFIDDILVSSQTALVYAPPANLPFGPHATYVVASSGSSSHSSSIRSFDIVQIQAPSLLSPISAAPLYIQRPLMEWNAVLGADYYEVNIDGAIEATTPAADFTPMRDLAWGDHSWYVVARNPYQLSAAMPATVTLIELRTPRPVNPPDRSVIPFLPWMGSLEWTDTTAQEYEVYFDGVFQTMEWSTQWMVFPEPDLGLHNWQIVARYQLAPAVWVNRPSEVWSFYLSDDQVIFVAPSGDDLNDGHSPFAPKQTIRNAMTFWVPGEEIRVAQGTYQEPLILDGHVLLGGYTEDFTDRNPYVYETALVFDSTPLTIGNPGGPGGDTGVADGFSVRTNGAGGWPSVTMVSDGILRNSVVWPGFDSDVAIFVPGGVGGSGATMTVEDCTVRGTVLVQMMEAGNFVSIERSLINESQNEAWGISVDACGSSVEISQSFIAGGEIGVQLEYCVSADVVLEVTNSVIIGGTWGMGTPAALALDNSGPDVIIANNTLISGMNGVAGGAAIFLANTVSPTIVNNLLLGQDTGWTQVGIVEATMDSSPSELRHNDIFNVEILYVDDGMIRTDPADLNDWTLTTGVAGTASDNISVDPQAGFEYRLNAQTPPSVTQGGLDSSAPSYGALIVDREGAQRTMPYSIGAYEWNQ